MLYFYVGYYRGFRRLGVGPGFAIKDNMNTRWLPKDGQKWRLQFSFNSDYVNTQWLDSGVIGRGLGRTAEYHIYKDNQVITKYFKLYEAKFKAELLIK